MGYGYQYWKIYDPDDKFCLFRSSILFGNQPNQISNQKHSVYRYCNLFDKEFFNHYLGAGSTALYIFLFF